MPAFRNVLMLPKAGDFDNGGLWENSSPVVEFKLNFAPRICLKHWNDWGELDWAKSKNNIAENLFALAPETHNTCFCISVINHDFILNWTMDLHSSFFTHCTYILVYSAFLLPIHIFPIHVYLLLFYFYFECTLI